MQWMADGADPDSGGTYAGRWEIVGLLALILLEYVMTPTSSLYLNSMTRALLLTES